jgi:hypothetical protein
MQLTSLNSKREVLTKIKRIEVKVSLAKLQKKSRYWYIYIYIYISKVQPIKHERENAMTSSLMTNLTRHKNLSFLQFYYYWNHI